MTKKTLTFFAKNGQVTDITVKDAHVTICVAGDRVAKIPIPELWDALRDYLAGESIGRTSNEGLQKRHRQAKRTIESTSSGNMTKPIGKQNFRTFKTNDMKDREL